MRTGYVLRLDEQQHLGLGLLLDSLIAGNVAARVFQRPPQTEPSPQEAYMRELREIVRGAELITEGD